MNILRISFVFLVSFFIPTYCCLAQDKPIGYWEAHMPYNKAIGVATDGNSLFTISPQSFFIWNSKQQQFSTYSKVEGMSDVGMSCIAYDNTTKTCVLAYTNSNIDLFVNNSFINIPDLKIKTVTGGKSIHQIFTEDGTAYVSTDIGVLVINLASKYITGTYVFSKNNQLQAVYGFASDSAYFYVITHAGLYRANKTNNQLQNFAAWQLVDSSHVFSYITSLDNKIYLCTANTVYAYSKDTLLKIYVSPISINHIDPGNKDLLICEYNTTTYKGLIKEIDPNSYAVIDSQKSNIPGANVPVQAVQLPDNNIWVADAAIGLGIINTSFYPYSPPGPADASNFDIYAYNKNVWIAHGGYNDIWGQDNNSSGLSNYNNGKWSNINAYNYPPFGDTVFDMVCVVKDEVNDVVYAGSFQDGLLIMNKDSGQMITNSPYLEHKYTFPSEVGVAGLALDNQQNLWITMFGAQPDELVVRTKDGNWYKYTTLAGGNTVYKHSGQNLIIDDYNQKWWVSPRGGGVFVYNDNGTLDQISDDSYRQLTTGVGNGNLPSNYANCLAKDKNGNIWIGTDNGIAIVDCPGDMTQSTCTCNGSGYCDARIPVVQYDQFAGYLFSGENVQTIAVDGANRKWVGTANGVWLLSPDASQIIYRFTQDNSPLPSNNIQKITVDPVTGDVYIGTDKGLMTYHSTATEGGDTYSNVLVYPDPVPSGYNGTIAIKGLVANADVRITDISGQLVYKTTALGGQAVWNGLDYTGHKPESGVYLIFTTNADGSQTMVSKLVFVQ